MRWRPLSKGKLAGALASTIAAAPLLILLTVADEDHQWGLLPAVLYGFVASIIAYGIGAKYGDRN